MSDKIEALFGGAQASAGDAKPEAGTRTGVEGEIGTGAPSDAFRAQFMAGDAIDGEKVLKSAWDTKRALTSAQQRLAELEKAEPAAPGTVDGYYEALDKAKLSELAPRVYQADQEADEASLRQIFESARLSGMGVKQAQAFVEAHYQRLNEGAPERDTRSEEERSMAAREAAMSAHPNGKLIAGDVQAWLQQRHSAAPFSDGEIGAIGKMMETSDGLALLWRLSRQGAGAPADLSEHGGAAIDPAEERREVMRQLATPDDAEWNANKESIISRYNRLNDRDRPWLNLGGAPLGSVTVVP